MAVPNRGKTESEEELDFKKVRKVVFEGLEEIKAKKFSIQMEEDEKWRRKHKTQELNMHCKSVADRRKKVDKRMIEVEKYGKELYYFIDRHKKTIYRKRNLLKCYRLLLDHRYQLEEDYRRTHEEEQKKDNKKLLAFSAAFQADARSAIKVGSDSRVGSTVDQIEAQRTFVRQQNRSEKPRKPRKPKDVDLSESNVDYIENIKTYGNEPDKMWSNRRGLTYEESQAYNGNYDANGFCIEEQIKDYGWKGARKNLIQYLSKCNDNDIRNFHIKIWKIYKPSDDLGDVIK
jgi:hypothetical protein